ncbi:MAG: ABC transporter permease [Oscillospiraceae bacterium]|nr:ABC transporter permease [Oscillospiraceae bacterium]
MFKRAARSIYAFIGIIVLGAKSQYRSFAGMALGSIAAPLLVAAVFIAAAPTISGIFARQKMNLVFCDLEGSAYFDTIINLLLADESVTRTVTVVKLDYDESLGALDSGWADAVIIFPDSFISDMSQGINRPVKILASESDPIRTVIIKEFMQSAADQLSAAQSAINTAWFNMDLERTGDTMRNLIFVTLTLEYTSKAFARSIYYTFHNVAPPFGNSSPAAFLTASALAALVFFGALPGVKRIIFERGAGIATRLAASGASSARVALYHFFPIYTKQLLCACIAILLALPAVTAAVAASDVTASSAAPGDGDIFSIIGGGLGFGSSDDSASENGSIEDSSIEDESSEDESSEGDSSEDGSSAGGTGSAIGGILNDAIDDRTGGADSTGAAIGAPDEAFKFSDIPKIIKASATKENVDRFADTFLIMCALCFFTSSLSLFCGCALKRPESADLLIVTLGIVMAIAGGTVIPYPYLPDLFQSIGGFCFNKWAHSLIASSLFGGSDFGVVGGIADAGNNAGGGVALAVFAALSTLLIVASTIKIKMDRT